MSHRTLKELIKSAALGAHDTESASPSRVEPTREKVALATPSAAVEDDGVEKLAASLNFIGQKGLWNLLKEAEKLETNEHMSFPEHTQKQEPHNAATPPVGGPATGQVANNAGERPGDGSTPAIGANSETGSSHPALSSNQAAIDVDKRAKSRRVAPTLDKLLKSKAYKDGKLKENLTGAAGKGDKNIKTAHDLGEVRAELARRVAAGGQ